MFIIPLSGLWNWERLRSRTGGRSLADPGVVLHLVQHISPSILFPVSRKWPNARDCLQEALIVEDRAVASPPNERERFEAPKDKLTFLRGSGISCTCYARNGDTPWLL